jgi:hypothetical protein
MAVMQPTWQHAGGTKSFSQMTTAGSSSAIRFMQAAATYTMQHELDVQFNISFNQATFPLRTAPMLATLSQNSRTVNHS